MRLVPRTLFGRTLLILAVGLLLAQASAVALNLFDRGRAVYRLTATQIAARIAQNARILNLLTPAERPKVVASIDGRHLRVYLSPQPVPVSRGLAEHDPYERTFVELLRAQLGAPWPVTVEITPRPEGGRAGPIEAWLARHYYFLTPGAYSIVCQVQLEDGSVAVFTAIVPQEPLRRLELLVPQLLLLVVVCFALAALLVYMTTRSLEQLARAADAVGSHPDGPPVNEAGPSEIRRVIRAFNRMRGRLRAHLAERTNLLGAISHDLRTPITRMRLRTEMLADREVGAKMQRDLDEMEAMVAASVAALTLYDMAKALQRDIVIERVELLEKEGGRSGAYRAEAAREPRTTDAPADPTTTDAPPRPASAEAAVITVSTRSAAGEREDTGGPAVIDALRSAGWRVDPSPLVQPTTRIGWQPRWPRWSSAGTGSS